MAAELEEIAYEASKSAVERQSHALDNLRSRTGTLIAAAALVASFLGTPALESSGGSWATAIGIVALLVVLGSCLAILWPYGFTFRLSAQVILEDHAETSEPTTPPRLYAFLARSLESHHDSNERILRRLHGLFQCASLALAVETIALLAAV